MEKQYGTAVTEKMEKKAVHVVSAWVGELPLISGQEKVDEKTNEINEVSELLKKLTIEGCTVTTGAMGTQKKTTRQSIAKEAGYMLQVKGNQGTLEEEISEYFDKEIFKKNKKVLEDADMYFKDMCNDHVRIEIRQYYIEAGWQML